MEDERLARLTRWTATQLQSMGAAVDEDNFQLTVVSGDASFRRYFRASLGGKSWISVDAPPETEDSGAFIAIANAWRKNGISVPMVHRADLEQGFMLLSDFGDQLYLPLLQGEGANRLYHEAFSELIKIQQNACVDGYSLPRYGRTSLLSEMQIFSEWFLQRQLEMQLSRQEQALLSGLFDQVVASALEQPQVCVHRDYHSRNLMWLGGEEGANGCIKEQIGGKIGVLDFQGAVIGPVTYDLASLLRDCYIDWSEPQITQWLLEYQQLAVAAAIIKPVESARFRRWFDLIGLQRHIKCLGLFSRLSIRDGKQAYLRDIPRTFNYVAQVCHQYEELMGFADWLDNRVLPLLKEQGLIE